MLTDVIAQEVLAATKPKYGKGSRLVVKIGKDQYALVTVNMVRQNKYHFITDDGTKGSVPTRSKNVIGEGFRKKHRQIIKEKDLDKHLKITDSKKTAGIDWDYLIESPIKYLKKLNINQIVSILNKASDAYYNTDKTLIPDNVYDIVENELRDRSPEHPQLKKIGAPIKKMGKVKLPYYMPSLDKVKPEDKSLDNWAAKFKGPYIVTDKLDGVSLLLIGKKDHWELYTRGDGTQGQDVSHLASFLRLPKPKDGYAIRAELLMVKSKFDKLFKEAAENPRNFASGLINRKSPDVKGTRNLDVIAYELIHPRLRPNKQLSKMKSLGFKIAPYQAFDEITSGNLSEYLEKRKASSKYEIDGLVVFQDKSYRRVSSGNPSYARAFKMITTDQMATVTVTKVEWNASKHGFLKPRIHIKPIRLGGVTIKHLTGFNAFFITNGYKLDETNKPKRPIGPGAVLKIIRSGDVIPHILDVLEGSQAPQMPKQNYEWNESGVDIYLADKDQSDEVAVKKITNFFRVIGVEHFAGGLVERFYKDGLKSIADIASADKRRMMRIDGIQDKTADKIYTGIKDALDGIELYRIMNASGVFDRTIGPERIKMVLDKFPNILKYGEKKIVDSVEGLTGFSTKTATSFAEGVPKFNEFIKELPQHKIKIARPEPKKKTVGALSGESICMTGFRDVNLAKKIEEQGGKVVSGVSGKTTLLLVKDDTIESGKTKKARDLGIRIMTKEVFERSYNL